jgi:hypothetical protein
MEQMRIGFDEAKETIGFALLPIMENLIKFINEQALPAFNAFIAGLTGNEGAVDGLDATGVAAYDLGFTIRSLAKSVGQLAAVFSTDGKSSLDGFVTALNFVAQTANVVVTIIKELISFIVEMANQVIGFLNLFGAGISKIKSIQGTAFASAWGTQSFATSGAPLAISGGGSYSLSSSATSGILGMTNPSGGSKISSAKSLSTQAGQMAAFDKILSDTAKVMDLVDQAMGVQQVGGYGSFSRLGEKATMINLTVNGAIDSESTARQIVEILNDSTARGTLGAGAFNYATDR